MDIDAPITAKIIPRIIFIFDTNGNKLKYSRSLDVSQRLENILEIVYNSDIVKLSRGGETGRPAGRQAGACLTKPIMVNSDHYVYVLKSEQRNYIYVGMTNNVIRRFHQHNQGKERTTAPYRPFQLIIVEVYPSRIEARTREKYLKSGSGKEWIKRTVIK